MTTATGSISSASETVGKDIADFSDRVFPAVNLKL